MSAPLIAVAPFGEEGLAGVIEGAGGQVSPPEQADAVIWTDPRVPEALGELLQSTPARWIQLPFAGIESFFEAGVIDPNRTWTCTKGVYGHSTAEHALALVLAAARQLHVHARARQWREGGFGSPERRLKDATVVIVGTGGIGKALTEMLQPHGARVIGVNRSGRPLEGAEVTVPIEKLHDVLGEADFVVIAAAHTPSTQGLFDKAAFDALKDNAWLVNVARGPLVDTNALLGALESGRMAGAALDVTDPEPLPDDHPLWAREDVLITPHIANTWDMAVPEFQALVARNVAAFKEGRPLEGLIDPAIGY